jgi:hypothetical protein
LTSLEFLLWNLGVNSDYVLGNPRKAKTNEIYLEFVKIYPALITEAWKSDLYSGQTARVHEIHVWFKWILLQLPVHSHTI